MGNKLIDAEHHSWLGVMNGCRDRFILQKNILKSNREFKGLTTLSTLQSLPSCGI